MTNEQTISAPNTARKLGDFCQTPTATDITTLFRVCHMQCELGIVTGEPGVGKTTVTEAYTRTEDNAYLATMSPASSRLVPCLERIGEALGAYPEKVGASAWSKAIRARLSRRYEMEPQLLLIDEAHHLSDESVEEIRAIFDASRVGVVFVGSREINERWTGRNWSQLTSRIYQRIDLDGPLVEDIDAICGAVGIEGEQARKLLHRVAGMAGGLRVVRKVIITATMLAGPDKPVTATHIKMAFQDREKS